jgi:hypothetical protein
VDEIITLVVAFGKIERDRMGKDQPDDVRRSVYDTTFSTFVAHSNLRCGV